MHHSPNNVTLFSTTGSWQETPTSWLPFLSSCSKNLFNLLKRTHPSQADHETPKFPQWNLEHIRPLSTGLIYSTQIYCSIRLRLSAINWTHLYGRFFITIKRTNHPILHINDEGTRFISATRLKDMETRIVWNYLITSWTSINTWLPNSIVVDQGLNFGDSFIRLASLDVINMEKTGIESHNGLSIFERYHAPIRSTVRNIHTYIMKENFVMVLALSIKSLNGTSGPTTAFPPP